MASECGTQTAVSYKMSTSKSTISDWSERTRSKSSSLMTDEDWDQLPTKEPQDLTEREAQLRDKEQQSDGGSMSASQHSSEETRLGDPLQIAGSRVTEKEHGCNVAMQSSPTKVTTTITEAGCHSTPSSPSEILRMTRRVTKRDGSSIEEATQFEKELGDWVRITEERR